MQDIIKLNSTNISAIGGSVATPAYDRSNVKTGIVLTIFGDLTNSLKR